MFGGIYIWSYQSLYIDRKIIYIGINLYKIISIYTFTELSYYLNKYKIKYRKFIYNSYYRYR